MQLIQPVLMIASAAALGWLALAAIHGGRFATNHWYLLYPLGAGLLTFGVFLISWAGAPIQPSSMAALAMLMALGLLLLALRGGLGDERSEGTQVSDASLDGTGPDRALMLTAIGILVSVAGVLAVARSYSSWDAIAIWGVKGYGIAEEGSILAGSDWGSHGLAYPLNLPLQIAAFRQFTGDWLPQSKLIFPMYYLALLIGSYRFLRQHVPRAQAGLSLVLIAASPIVFEHATNGYANLPFSVYLVLGFLNLVDGALEHRRALSITGGLLLGLATWTRPEGVYLVGLGGAAVWLAARSTRAGASSDVAWALPVVGVAVPWQVFSVVGGYQSGVGGALTDWLQAWLRSEFHLGDAYRVLRYFAWQAVQVQFWGVTIPALTLVLVMGVRRLRVRRNPVQLLLGAATIAVFFTLGGYYYLASFTNDLVYLLSTSVERIAMPGMILAAIWISTMQPGGGSAGKRVTKRDDATGHG